MKPISSWFRTRKSSSEPSTPVPEGVLEDLEAQADSASLGFRWVPLNRAGDLCERAGDRAEALKYYGRAIDAMLEDGQPEPARGLATKIVRIHPTAVRTLCTLTWLDLASHHMASVVVHLTEYVESAQAGGVQDLAGEQIYMMAQVAADTTFRAAAAEALDVLESADDAAKVRAWVEAGRAPHDTEDSQDWTDRCLSHALGSNAQKIQQVKRRREAATFQDGLDSGPDVPGDANREGTREANPEQVEEVGGQTDQTADGKELPERSRT